jgi:hypothetical protein
MLEHSWDAPADVFLMNITIKKIWNHYFNLIHM